MFDFSNYWTNKKYHHDSNKLVVGKMKDETPGVVIKEFFWIKVLLFGRW